jgi:hypothetical protein
MSLYGIDPESGQLRDTPEPPTDEQLTEFREKEAARRYAVLAAKRRYRDMGVPECHNKIITPETNPLRFSVKEKALFDAGKCCWQVEYGTGLLDGDEGYCGEKSRPGATYGYCEIHDDELLEQFCPDGSRR